VKSLAVYLATKNVRSVSRILKLPLSTVHYWIKRFKQTNAVELKPILGRPKKTSQRADRLLYFLARANGFATSSDLLRLWQERVSQRTVLRRLRARHLRQYRSVRVPLLTQDQKRARLDWAMRRCHWRSLWKRVVWSDESRFLLYPVSGRTLVWCFPHERLNEKFLVQVSQAGGGSVHVWGSIWIGGRSELIRLQGTVNAVSYCDVLHGFFSSSVLPAHCWFQQDNAPAHRSWITTQLLEDMDVRVLPWPARSPDLNPIEHVWDILGRRMQHRACQSLNELFDALKEEWHSIPQEDLDDLIHSMPRRVGMVITKHGGHTKY
jgi:transposase